MFDTAVDALAPRGNLIVIGMMSAYAAGWPRSQHEGLAEKLLWKSASVRGFFLLRYAPLWRLHLAALVALVGARRLHVALDDDDAGAGARFVGIEAVPAAVARLQGGASQGKVVVQIARELPPLGEDDDGGGGLAAAPPPMARL